MIVAYKMIAVWFSFTRASNFIFGLRFRGTVVDLSGLVNSFRCAFSGLWHVLRTQRNMRIHFAAAALALFLSFALHLSGLELLPVFFAITLVMTAEMVNTAFESVIDLVAPEYHPAAGAAKDVAAGAVLVTALNSLAVAALLFLPRFFSLSSFSFVANVREVRENFVVLPAGILTGILFIAAVQKFQGPAGKAQHTGQAINQLERPKGKCPQIVSSTRRESFGANKWQELVKELVERAKDARRNAYAPYSKFKVGAAVLTAGGKIYTGCNVENASYGLSMCAERVAVFKAAAAGERDFRAIAVAGGGEDFCFPCGACRQVLAEFCRYKYECLEQGGVTNSDSKGGAKRDNNGRRVASCRRASTRETGAEEGNDVSLADGCGRRDADGCGIRDIEVIVINGRGDVVVRYLSELLPDAFML